MVVSLTESGVLIKKQLIQQRETTTIEEIKFPLKGSNENTQWFLSGMTFGMTL